MNPDLIEKLTPHQVKAIFQLEKEIVVSEFEIKGLCPFHKEENPSFCLNLKTTQYFCHSCAQKGNLHTFLKLKNLSISDFFNTTDFIINKDQEVLVKEKQIIDPNVILVAKKALKENKNKLDQIMSFNITEPILDQYDIGYQDGRFWIPIKDESGNYVDIRRYDPDSKGTAKVLGYKRGYGGAKLYPIEALNEDTIYILEGEKDTLVARSLNLNAITNTCGANTWKSEWNVKFKSKNIVICMDIDDAGCAAAMKRAQNLYPHASQIKIVNLPLDKIEFPTGDFTNYISKGFTRDDFLLLVDDTNVYKDNKKESTVFKVILSEASKNKYINKKCFIKNIIVCGKDSSPYGAAKKIEAKCMGSSTEAKCSKCSLLSGNKTIELDPDNMILLDLIRDQRSVIMSRLKAYLGIQKECKKHHLDIVDFYTVEKLRIVPDITYNIEEEFEHVYRTAYYVTTDDKKVETNKSYNIKAVTCLDIKTQTIQHQIFDIESGETTIDDFKLNDDTILKLKRFQVETTIEDKINDIYNDFSKISSIFGREDMFLVCDLSYHSALTFNFQNKSIGKGWVESCIVGDSGVAKSTISKFLRDHYLAGEFISGESNSFAGLVGGLNQIGGCWQLQWGRLPLNDRRLVIIDEAQGIPEDDIAKLSEIRSSGEAKIQKIISEKTRARTRIIWLANPRKNNLGIKNYSYGVLTIKELFGKPEDVRRVDIAMTAASGEIPIILMNQQQQTSIIKYDSDSCHKLVMFAWSRKSDQIVLESEAELEILRSATNLSRQYIAAIPLVEPSDIRNKIARLATALAIRLFSVDPEKPDNVLVKKEHVFFITKFLKKLYNKPRFAYNEYSANEIRKTVLIDKREVINLLQIESKRDLEDFASAIIPKRAFHDMILSALERDKTDMYCTGTPDQADLRRHLKRLRRNNAIDEHDRFFVLTPALIDFIRELHQYFDSNLTVEEIKNKLEDETISLNLD